MATKTNTENEKKFVLPLIIAGMLTIILFHGLYWPEFTILTNDPLFIILDGLGIAGFLIASYLAWKHREGGKDNITRWIALVIAAAVCIWVGMWCSQYREDSKKGIEYKYNRS